MPIFYTYNYIIKGVILMFIFAKREINKINEINEQLGNENIVLKINTLGLYYYENGSLIRNDDILKNNHDSKMYIIPLKYVFYISLLRQKLYENEILELLETIIDEYINLSEMRNHIDLKKIAKKYQNYIYYPMYYYVKRSILDFSGDICEYKALNKFCSLYNPWENIENFTLLQQKEYYKQKYDFLLQEIIDDLQENAHMSVTQYHKFEKEQDKLLERINLFYENSERALKKNISTNSGVGTLSLPQWFKSNKEEYVYLYSYRSKANIPVLLGKYEYFNNTFTKIANDYTYDSISKVYRLESLVGALINNKIHNKKYVISLLKKRTIELKDFGKLDSFTIDDLYTYADTKFPEINFYLYSKEQEKLKKMQHKEYLDSLPQEERDDLRRKAMMASMASKRKNKKDKEYLDSLSEEDRQFILYARQTDDKEQQINETACTKIDSKKIDMPKLSEKASSINVNNYIKNIEEIDNGLKVYMTYKFYDLKNLEDKKGFLEALTYKLKMKDIDTKLYKVSSIKRTKYYADCLEIDLVKR